MAAPGTETGGLGPSTSGTPSLLVFTHFNMTTPSKTTSPTEEQIAHRAREIWKSRGNPIGKDTEIWLEAERQLRTPTTAENAPSPTSGRGNGNSQISRTPADPKPSDLKKPAPSGTAAGAKPAPAGRKGAPTEGKGSSKATPAATKGAPTEGKTSSAGGKGTPAQTERLRGEMASESEVEFQITPAVPDDEAIKAALQKRDARAPKTPTKDAPHAKPPESGKPLWNKPHSS